MTRNIGYRTGKGGASLVVGNGEFETGIWIRVEGSIATLILSDSMVGRNVVWLLFLVGHHQGIANSGTQSLQGIQGTNGSRCRGMESLPSRSRG